MTLFTTNQLLSSILKGCLHALLQKPVFICTTDVLYPDVRPGHRSSALQSKENRENKNRHREWKRNPRKTGIQEWGYSLLEISHHVQSGNIFKRISSGEDQRDFSEKVRGHAEEHAELRLRWESNLTDVWWKMIMFSVKKKKKGHIWSWLWRLGRAFRICQCKSMLRTATRRDGQESNR